MPPPSSPPIAEIQRGDAEVIEKRRVVRAGAQRADAQVVPAANVFCARRPVLASRDAVGLQALPDGDLRFGILDVARHAVDEFLERVRAFDCQEARGRCRRS